MTGRWNRTATIGVAVGAFAAGAVVAHRPATAAAERNEKKDAEAGGKVGYVLTQRLLIESARAKAHGQQLAEVRRKFDDRLAGLRDKAAAAANPFQLTGRAKDGADSAKQAQAAQQEFQDAEGEARREFDARSDRLLAEMYKEVAVVAAQLAREYGLDAVQTYPIPPGTIDFRQQKDLLGAPGALLYVRRDADLTDEMLKRLDKRYEAEAGVE